VSGYLKDGSTVSPLVEQLIFGQAADRQAAKDERPGIEAQRLGGLLPVLPDQLNPLCLLEFLFRYDQSFKFSLLETGIDQPETE
jgi:hypothetical protein